MQLVRPSRFTERGCERIRNGWLTASYYAQKQLQELATGCFSYRAAESRHRTAVPQAPNTPQNAASHAQNQWC